MEHKEKKRFLTLQGGELRSAEPTKPSEFVEDEQIPWDDWLYAIDKWVETMETEDIGKKTRRAWNSFNDQVRKHTDHTRQTKTKRKRIKRNDDLAPEQKEKKLEELRKFDPSAWPKKNFKRIKKDLKKKRELAIEKEIKDIKASTAGQSSSSSSKKGPPQQPAAAPSGSGTQKPKPFRDNVPKGPNPCSRCGSKVYHDSRKCMAEALAADTTKKTFAITNA
ncbi:unnamed protein product [Tilletia laevis]|uniref:Uncharacterized protein n=1 Tax=Tilletia caries TaxID=13290 RepID=A0A177T378_9BASI|nr:hypothetical protein CF328_g8504 [Tilletia controversa]KAE8184700.1 hypothetical protein CF336_g7697 [Tilletia laevis]KAE8243891.1 hypothetical protein A4X03_0g7655 [Tilletia caries]KAE8188229.1 hypothetical protein CF335_g6952 [Tilletia laevis]CAD6900265.1 unnamed protein product [Tilletia laevis]